MSEVPVAQSPGGCRRVPHLPSRSTRRTEESLRLMYTTRAAPPVPSAATSVPPPVAASVDSAAPPVHEAAGGVGRRASALRTSSSAAPLISASQPTSNGEACGEV